MAPVQVSHEDIDERILLVWPVAPHWVCTPAFVSTCGSLQGFSVTYMGSNVNILRGPGLDHIGHTITSGKGLLSRSFKS